MQEVILSMYFLLLAVVKKKKTDKDKLRKQLSSSV